MRNVNSTLMMRICSVCFLALATGGCSYTRNPEAPEVAPVEFELHGADKEAYLDSLQFSGALKGEDASIDGLAREIEALRKQYISAATPADRERFAPLLKEATNEIIQRLYEHTESYRSLADGLSELYERLRQRSGSATGAPVQADRECGSAALPVGSILDRRCRPGGDDAPVCVRHDSLREVETDELVASNPRCLALSAASLERRWRVALTQAEALEMYAYRYGLLLDQLKQNPDFYLLKRPVP